MWINTAAYLYSFFIFLTKNDSVHINAREMDVFWTKRTNINYLFNLKQRNKIISDKFLSEIFLSVLYFLKQALLFYNNYTKCTVCSGNLCYSHWACFGHWDIEVSCRLSEHEVTSFISFPRFDHGEISIDSFFQNAVSSVNHSRLCE